jgi:hypothetical protein
MKSMGKKEKMGPVEVSNKARVVYPSTCFSSKVLPDVKDMKMGETFEVRAKYKITGMHEAYDDKTEIRCDADMLSCEVIDGPEAMKEAKVRNLTRRDWEEIKGKKKNA